MDLHITIALGWWIIPLAISAFLIVRYGFIVHDPWGFAIWIYIIPGTLGSWLIWALLKAFNVISS